MARGGIGGRRGIALSDRVRAGTGVGAPDDEGPGRHCWVAGAVDDHGVKRPGLLVEWRQGRAGWEGRVVYVAQLRAGQWLLVEEWLPAELLTPR